MRLYVSQIVGGHEIDDSIYLERGDALEDFEEEQVAEAEKNGKYDGYGDTLTIVDIDAWVIIVTWTEPDPGIRVHGPYGNDRSAHADVGRVLEEYHGIEGAAPEDVEIEVQKLD